MKGKIYLIPVTLGGDDFLSVIPQGCLEITRKLRCFAVEDIRSARRYLRMIDSDFPVDSTEFHELSEHTDDREAESLIEPVLKGSDMGIMSEAGMPGIADPGSKLIMAAHSKQVQVIPLTGPSSILLALIASGLDGQNFTFNGYLPVKDGERIRKLKELERKAREGYSQIFIETPYRNQKLFEAILAVCSGDTLLSVAADLTLPGEYIRTKKIAEWKKDIPVLHKRLVIFVLR
ncbi:MAG: SAM-dependent methyltransferase [Bacteroidales bacterium]|nr:SAM-dependent methyltransferase [Bacteroidales bacterium]MBN2634055.1 SAM-dependent methyltransferase [Bacteroidales bacterium]